MFRAVLFILIGLGFVVSLATAAAALAGPPQISAVLISFALFLASTISFLKISFVRINFFWLIGLMIYFPGFLLTRLCMPYSAAGEHKTFYFVTGLVISLAGFFLAYKGQRLAEKESDEKTKS